MKVKDMSRRQQKAVFASMGKGSVLTGSNTKARREKLLRADMGYKQLKKSGVKLKPNADHDNDGVKNSKDCRPMNKNKQDLLSKGKSFFIKNAIKAQNRRIRVFTIDKEILESNKKTLLRQGLYIQASDLTKQIKHQKDLIKNEKDFKKRLEKKLKKLSKG